MGPSSRTRVQLTAKVAYRFYAPVVLIKALNSTCQKKRFVDLDPSADATQSAEHTFQYFVNILAHLCDNGKGGETVTAFTVLQNPDHVEYRFASNERDIGQFIDAQHFISSILRILGSMKEHEKQGTISKILRKSLYFSRSRVMVEINTLLSRAEECISACKMEDSEESPSILEKLEELREGSLVASSEELSDDAFTEQCESLINSIKSFRQTEIYELICERTKEDNMDESEKWCEFRHVTGRLFTYLRAAKFLVSMPKRWPALFDSFHVNYIPSSIPDVCPFRGKRSHDKVTADTIIGFMTSNPNKQNEYRAYAQELQKIRLDQELLRHAERQKMRPLIHAEILLHESLKNGNLFPPFHPASFFNGYKYIGSSKPTCKLCFYYFSEYGSGVEVRQTHHNLYPAWRMPDVYEDQGSDIEKSQKLMDSIVARVRQDAFRILKEKVADGRRHDSNTDSWYLKDATSVRSHTVMEDLTLSMRSLNFPSSQYHEDGMSVIAEKSSCDEDEDEDENGGVKLLPEEQYAVP